MIEGFDHSGKTAYVKACYKNKVVPVSYYLRHMHESELKLRHHQLGCYAIKPIAISLVVSGYYMFFTFADLCVCAYIRQYAQYYIRLSVTTRLIYVIFGSSGIHITQF